MIPKWHASVRSFDIRRLSAQERAVETIEYIGLGAAMVALLGGVWVTFDRGGAQRVGAAVVRTTECWISSLNDAVFCPSAEEIAQVPPEVLTIPEPTPPPNWSCALVAPEYYDLCVQGPQPPPTEPPPPTLGDRSIDFLEKQKQAFQAGKDDLEELLAGLPEDRRGMLLAGMPGLLLLLLLLLASPVGGAALLGSVGFLGSLLAGWLYGQGHLGNDFNLLAAFASGVFAWLFGFFGLQGLGEGALALRERRRGPGWARLLPQDGVPGDDESWWDKLLVALGVLAPAETLSWRGLGILARVPVKHPLVLALFGVGLLLLTVKVESTAAGPNSIGFGAEVRELLAARPGGEEQPVQPSLAGEPAMPQGPQLDPDRFDPDQVNWLENNEQRVRHILEGSPRVRPQGHGWERLVPNIGQIPDIYARYRAILPQLQDAVRLGNVRLIRAEQTWRIMEYTHQVNGQNVVVRLFQDLQAGAVQITDAFVAIP